MLKVDQVVIIRHKVLNEGRPIREVARDMGVSRNTVRKYVRRVPDWKPKPVKRRSPKMERFGPLIDALLEEWSKRTTKKQRITGTRVHKHLVGKGHDVGITTVRTYLRRKRRAEAEVTIPLVHRPGAEGQVDFFDVTVDVAGERRDVHAFVMSLPYSDWDYGRLYEQEDLPSFLDGHVRVFDRAGFVPRRLVYDNAKVAVDRIEGGQRQLNTHFQQLVAHYAFETSFTRVGEGHDKGAIEVRGKRLRLDHLVPIPAGETLEEINAALLESLEATARHRKNIEGRTVVERLVEEQAAALALPAVAFDPRLPARVQVTGQSTVRLGGGTYSVPSHWAAARSVMAWVGATDVRFEHGGEQVLRPRERRGGKQIRYLHYLPQLARRPQAVRQVAPELVAELGSPWQHLWQLLVTAHDERRAGRVLAALLGAVVHHDAETLSAALQAVLSEGARHLGEEGRVDGAVVVPRRLIAVPEHLAVHDVEAARAADYDPLLLGGGS
jgi:transposase